MGLLQKLVIKFFPKNWVAAIEKDSRAWTVRCKCGHGNPLWDLGGMRGPSAGKTHWRRTCEKCGQKSWQEVVYEPDISTDQQ